MLVGGYQESGGSASWVEDSLVLLGVNDGDDEVNDVAWRTELTGVALATQDGQQVFEGVTEALGVVVLELVDDLEEGPKRLRITIGQEGVLEDVPKQERDPRVLGHLGDSLGIEVQGLMTAEA